MRQKLELTVAQNMLQHEW